MKVETHNLRVKTHNLKSWPEYFSASMFGAKPFEVRINDRDYKVGDILQLEEWNPETKLYTGRRLTRQVSYIMEPAFGMPENLIVMALVMV